jgi:acyl carrier protein
VTLDSVFERISRVLADQFEPEKDFKPETRLVGDLHVDELDLFEFAVGLESEFAAELNGREVSEEEVEKFVTVRDAVEFIRARARGG